MAIPYDPIYERRELDAGGEFAAPTRDQWLALVDTVLKGAHSTRNW